MEQLMMERTSVVETRSNIIANMEHAKDQRNNTQKDAIRSQRIKNSLGSISYSSRIKTVSQAVKTDITPPFEIKTKNYSSLNKVLRITAYTNRFIKKLKKINTPRGVPTANKTEMANITG